MRASCKSSIQYTGIWCSKDITICHHPCTMIQWDPTRWAYNSHQSFTRIACKFLYSIIHLSFSVDKKYTPHQNNHINNLEQFWNWILITNLESLVLIGISIQLKHWRDKREVGISVIGKWKHSLNKRWIANIGICPSPAHLEQQKEEITLYSRKIR